MKLNIEKIVILIKEVGHTFQSKWEISQIVIFEKLMAKVENCKNKINWVTIV